jgi:hypothetical protein
MEYDIYKISSNTSEISKTTNEISNNLNEIQKQMKSNNDILTHDLQEISSKQTKTNEYLKQLVDYHKCKHCENGYKYISCNICKGRGYHYGREECRTCGNYDETKTYTNQFGYARSKFNIKNHVIDTMTNDCNCNYDKGWVGGMNLANSNNRSIAGQLRKELYELLQKSNYANKHDPNLHYDCIIMKPKFDQHGNISSYAMVCLAEHVYDFWGKLNAEPINKFDYLLFLFFDCWLFRYNEYLTTITMKNLKTNESKSIRKGCVHYSQRYSVTEKCMNHRIGEKKVNCVCYNAYGNNRGERVICDRCGGSGFNGF